ncbi:MAG: ATP-grasp domain-containing protein [Chloroflexota bacterium]
MATILVLYPAYGTVSCHQVADYAENIGNLRLILADDEPTASDEDIFDEVMELPPPHQLTEAYDILRYWFDKRRPDGIFMQSERGLLLGSILANEFELKGPPVKAAHLCSNKYQQRVALSNAGIGNPQFALAESATDVHRLARSFGFPIVLKCVISTMSRLVTLVNRPEEIDNAVMRMQVGLEKSLDVARLLGFAKTAKVDLGCDPKRQFLVESFLQGDFVETDGLVGGDKPCTFGVTEQIQSVNPPFFIEGYLFPAECTDTKPILSTSDAILKAVDLHYSGFSIEMRVFDNKISVMEVNGRLGWDEGFGDLFQVRTHRDRIVQTLQLALGIEPEPIRDESRFAALAYRSYYHDGMVEDLPTREELVQRNNGEVKLGLATHKGARFLAPPNPDCYPHIAWALATHPVSSHKAYEKARKAVDKLDISMRRL